MAAIGLSRPAPASFSTHCSESGSGNKSPRLSKPSSSKTSFFNVTIGANVCASQNQFRKTSSELLRPPDTAPARLVTIFDSFHHASTSSIQAQRPPSPPVFKTNTVASKFKKAQRPYSLNFDDTSMLPTCASGVFSAHLSATLPTSSRAAASGGGSGSDILRSFSMGRASLVKESDVSGALAVSCPIPMSCPVSASTSLSLVDHISGDDLAALMELSFSDARRPLIMDTRKADAHKSCHIITAHMTNCTTRVMMKRTCTGLHNILIQHPIVSNNDYAHGTLVPVVVYNDTGVLQGAGAAAGGGQAALLLSFIEKLREIGCDVYLLDGGITAFRRRHSNLCEFNTQSHACMYSPTNPDSESSAADIYNTSVSCILTGFLYIGNERDASSLEELRSLSITKVINVTSHVKCYHQENGVQYCRLSATDCNSQDMRQYFEEAFQFIDEARMSGQRVLVHCHAGVSRSATIVIAYLMKHTPLNMQDAYTFVKERRNIISPNFNFLGQLHLFEQDLNSGKVLRDILPHLLRKSPSMIASVSASETASSPLNGTGDAVASAAPVDFENRDVLRSTTITSTRNNKRGFLKLSFLKDNHS